MSFLASIISYCNSACNYFFSLYVEAYYWISPFNKVALIFYHIAFIFNGLGWDFYNFSTWVTDVTNKIASVLTWEVVVSYINSYFPNLSGIITWFSDWWNYVINAVSTWWSSAQYVVQGWINSAVSSLSYFISSLQSQIASLSASVSQLLGQLPSISEILAWFGNWWGNVWSTITTWWGSILPSISDLIDSTVRTYFPFYNELAALWADIALFFSDPQAWIYERMDDFFERFW